MSSIERNSYNDLGEERPSTKELKPMVVKDVTIYVSRDGRAFKDPEGENEYSKITKVSKGRKYIGIAIKVPNDEDGEDIEAKYIWHSLARIIAEAFLDEPDMKKLGASRPEQLCTEAIDGDRTNVSADNLVWSVPWLSQVKVCPYCKKGVRGKAIHPECKKKMDRKQKLEKENKNKAKLIEESMDSDDEQLKQMLELRKQGLSYAKIGEKLGVSRQAVGAKLKRAENRIK